MTIKDTPPDYSDAVTLMLRSGMREAAKQLEVQLAAKGLYQGSIATEDELDKFITVDNDMLTLKEDVRRLVPLHDPVLIQGETGTGKEIIARALHGNRGPYTPTGTTQVHGRFVDVNCTALSPDLMYSELFGHVAGAFTGALKDRVGKLQYAYKGTLFIDEIGDMPLNMQSALLRAFQEKKITRAGDNVEIEVDFRLVCATHRDVEKMIEQGTFREDLYYRISVFELRTKPIRERLEDASKILESLGISDPDIILGTGPLQIKGNVRELQRMVKRYKRLGHI